MEKKFEKNLNPQQQEAVQHVDGPLLVVAGAGSGKTRVITYRMAYLIHQGIKPGRILGLTFTNKAADEMRERVRSLVNAAPLVCTFHSFGVRILRREIHLLGYTPRFVIYDEDDSLRAVKEAMKSLKLGKDVFSPKEARVAISRQKNEVAVDRSVANERPSFNIQLQAVSEKYHSILKQNNAVDFDDLILLPLRLFEENPQALRYYQQHYRYLLVDEYQDTNAPQYRLIKMLCRKHKNICVVGDPDQSIYRWRGSDIRNILNFEKDFPGARKIVLEENYRSTTFILDAANSLIRNNSRRSSKNLWSGLGEGEDVCYVQTDSHDEEACYVVETIQRLVAERGLKYRDIAVFYRTHALSRVIEEYLRAENVPYTVIGGPGFYARKEIKDIVAYLRVVVSPDDLISLMRIINVPSRGIGKVTLGRLAEASLKKGIPLYQMAKKVDSLPKISSSGKKALSSFATMMEEFREQAQSVPVYELTEAIIARTGYREMLKREFPEDAEDRIDNLRELTDTMVSYLEENPESGLDDFLERISLLSDVDTWEDEMNRVSLMTAHNSKGLEFEAVVIIGLEEGIFPHINSMYEPVKLEEERRLCYVGVTRAKRFLYLTAAASRIRHGLYTENEESRFTYELLSSQWEREDAGFRVEERLPRKARASMEVDPPQEEFHVGEKVVHPSFGSGKVVNIEEGYTGPILWVLFDGDGESTPLAARFAPLRKM